jgi:isorenieratene synthase
LRPWLAVLIRRGFGGYEQQINRVDESAPEVAVKPKRVLVIGGGLAGISSAANLAARGMDVTLREKSSYLGGKIGAWHVQADDGTRLEVEHGFHAFFRHYYNLRRFLDASGVSRNLKPIDDYLIIGARGQRWRFRDVEPTPVLNLIALASAGLYRWRDILLGPAVHKMDVFLEYDADATFEMLDGTSYRAFAEEAALPAELRLVFNTFARAFFAEEDRMSMAELVKSFHFFYLSHDHGLLYDYPADDYQTSVIAPIRRYLEDQGVGIELGRGVERITPVQGGVEVDGQRFDYVVLATSSVGARSIAERSPALASAAPVLADRLEALRPSQRYAVWRIWLDREMRDDVPVFFATERRRMLDAVTAYHRITQQARAWAAEERGSVVELHCYAVPDDIRGEDVRDVMWAELVRYFPELEGATIVYDHLQVEANFTAFHVGMQADRPETETGIEGLYLAGDWVKIPIPAMLMEAAYSSGLIAANAILAREGLREHAVYTVPRKGLLTGLPRPKRRPVGVPDPAASTRTAFR